MEPEMYLCVLPVTRNLEIAEPETDVEIIDYALKMKRIYNSKEMDRLLADDKVTKEHIEKLVAKIAGLHKNTRVIKNAFMTLEFHEEFADIANHYDFISGFHRDCHGVLKTSNIFLYDDPVIFDCIEFSSELQHIDVLNDIAFLCVDLDFYGREDLSELFYIQPIFRLLMAS